MGKFLYFAYGSNLLAKRIHINNPTAIRKGAGKLPNYRLDFITYSNSWKGASATIVPTPGNMVWGALWEIDQEDMQSLDRQEGVHVNLYKPMTVEIETAAGQSVSCRTYQQTAVPEDLSEGESLPLDRRPSEAYKNCILDGAVETHLPSDYIAKLKLIPSVPTKGEINLSVLLGAE